MMGGIEMAGVAFSLPASVFPDISVGIEVNFWNLNYLRYAKKYFKMCSFLQIKKC